MVSLEITSPNATRTTERCSASGVSWTALRRWLKHVPCVHSSAHGTIPYSTSRGAFHKHRGKNRGKFWFKSFTSFQAGCYEQFFKVGVEGKKLGKTFANSWPLRIWNPSVSWQNSLKVWSHRENGAQQPDLDRRRLAGVGSTQWVWRLRGIFWKILESLDA